MTFVKLRLNNTNTFILLGLLSDTTSQINTSYIMFSFKLPFLLFKNKFVARIAINIWRNVQALKVYNSSRLMFMLFENECCFSWKGTRKHLSQKSNDRNCFWRVVTYQYFVVKWFVGTQRRLCVYDACFVAYSSRTAPTALLVLSLRAVWCYVQHPPMEVRLKGKGTLNITWQEEKCESGIFQTCIVQT